MENNLENKDEELQKADLNVDEPVKTELNDNNEIPGGAESNGETRTPDAITVDDNTEPKPQPIDEAQNKQPPTAPEKTEKMLSQTMVNELVGKARQEGRESALKDLRQKYGVNSDQELDGIFGKGQTYDDLNEEYSHKQDFYGQVMAENALLKSHIDASRWEDVKLILGGKGLEVTTENIEELIPSHPEWRGANGEEPKQLTPETGERIAMTAQQQVPQQPVATLRKLGNEVSQQNGNETEEAKLKRLFGM